MKNNLNKSFRFILGFLAILCLAVSTFTATAEPLTYQDEISPFPPEKYQTTPAAPLAGPGLDTATNAVHLLYFYAEDCPHCKAIHQEILTPLKQTYGIQFDLHLLNIADPKNYELLMAFESHHQIAPEDRGLPTTIIGDQIIIGEDESRARLEIIVTNAIENKGCDWPNIAGFNPSQLPSMLVQPPFTLEGDNNPGVCSEELVDACGLDAPIYAAFFYQVGCQSCSRVEADLAYLQTIYPQLIVEKFNIYDDAGLAAWMAERTGRNNGLHTPALFIGERAWIGEEEITPAAIETTMENIKETGAEKFWTAYDPDQNSMVERFRSMRWLTIVIAGLIDGLNPCAFATIIFFVSYLSISGRKGREILSVGAAFTAGVFIAYLSIGLGFYKVLDLLGSLLTTLGRWVYGITAVLCLVLAVVSLVDYFKVRKGGTADLSFKLPETLRSRINKTIRKGRNVRAYVFGAFLTGLVVSFLELACTGQIYLPTIIFVSSIPDLRTKAVSFLSLYNLMFIVPLIVVFILAYYGTTSKQLVEFLEKRAAAVKLGMVVLFLSLGGWLLYSLFS
jgi:cytochrome c biogenesis protein CcdA/glutaredoxin